MSGWNEQLNNIGESLPFIIPELILALAILFLLTAGLFKPGTPFLLVCTVLSFVAALVAGLDQPVDRPVPLFDGMLQLDGLSLYLRILIDVAGILTCIMSLDKTKAYASEYFMFIIAVALGGHLLLVSTDFLMVFLSLEFISISSYVLAVYAFNKAGSEGSLKYFLFGSVASAVMVYGFSILYGVSGTLNFSSTEFLDQLMLKNSPLVLLAAVMALAGFLYKITAVPMHPWAPDVYEAAPIPVIAFLSVAPKLAGLGILTKFILAMNLFGQSIYDWQIMISVIAMLSITMGNFSALRQHNAKRMMAYSSIAQSGFLLVGIAAFLPQGIHFMLFYASIYLIMNFLVFIILDRFEKLGIASMPAFSGTGKKYPWQMIFLLIGFISLTGLPPTAGFTGKLLIFSALWESYELTGKSLLLVLLVFGLVNTVVSLFYYLRIPYFAFLKNAETGEKASPGQPDLRYRWLALDNLLALILVVLLLVLFFVPGLLMGWINKINFVL